MKLPELEPGLVIRYDYLWNHEHLAGRMDGRKDRPCAVVLMIHRDKASREIYVCPVTHRDPGVGSGILIPPRVRTHLRLDDLPQWIVTTEVNQIYQENGRIPPGIVPASMTRDVFGHIPSQLLRQLVDAIRANVTTGRLSQIKREEGSDDFRRSR